MPNKQIKLFKLTSSLTSDLSRIEFQFMDGTSYALDLPPHRYAAAVATLQSSSICYYSFNSSNDMHFISSAPDSPGFAQFSCYGDSRAGRSCFSMKQPSPVDANAYQYAPQRLGSQDVAFRSHQRQKLGSGHSYKWGFQESYKHCIAKMIFFLSFHKGNRRSRKEIFLKQYHVRVLIERRNSKDFIHKSVSSRFILRISKMLLVKTLDFFSTFPEYDHVSGGPIASTR